MPKILQKSTSNLKGTRLFKEEIKFKISFEVKLDNHYEIKDMKLNHIQEFHRFLLDTVYKGLTISQVDNLFLRKQGDAPAIKSNNNKDLMHYGKKRKSIQNFRLL